MLKKLYKYDWKSVAPLLLILHGILLVYSIIGRLLFSIAPESSLKLSSANFYAVFTGFYYMLYTIFIIGIVIATAIYLAVRTQKSLFSDEGYLTHTLPVTPTKILLSKIFIIWTWMVIDLFCVAVSVFILIANNDTLSVIRHGFSTLLQIFSGSYGVSGQLSAVFLLLSAIVQYLGYYTTLLLFSLCLGNLFKNHKIMGAVLSFFGIHTVLSIVNTFLALGTAVTSPAITAGSGISVTDGAQAISYMPAAWLFIFMFVYYLLLSLAFFFGSRHILSKKLNLA